MDIRDIGTGQIDQFSCSFMYIPVFLPGSTMSTYRNNMIINGIPRLDRFKPSFFKDPYCLRAVDQGPVYENIFITIVDFINYSVNSVSYPGAET